MTATHADFWTARTVYASKDRIVDGVTLFEGSARFEAFRTLGLVGYREWAEKDWTSRTDEGRIGFSAPGHMLKTRPLSYQGEMRPIPVDPR